jgi:Amino acid permease
MALMTDSAPSVAGAPTREREAYYLRTALALSATAYLGFWFTYFGPNLRGTYPAAAPAVHLHGWSFFAWYLLLPLQAGLIHARRVRAHRTLGWSSLGLAAVMTATGTLVLGVQMAQAAASPEPSYWSSFGLMIFATLLLFVGFYTAAIVLRRDRAIHKRLMLVAGAAGVGAAAFRIAMTLFGPVDWATPAGILATNRFILGGIGYDAVRERRVHRVYWFALAICLVVEVSAWLGAPTGVGQSLARGLAWVGHTFAGLY